MFSYMHLHGSLTWSSPIPRTWRENGGRVTLHMENAASKHIQVSGLWST